MNATTITSLEASEMNLALTEPFAIAKGAPAVAANVLVRVELADGTVGLGEAAPFTEVSGETQQGSPTVLINDRAAARDGDPAKTCNDPTDLPVGTVVASSSIIVGG